MNKLVIICIVFISCNIFSQSEHPAFKKYLLESPNVNTTFCIKDDIGISDFLKSEGVKIKYRTEKWIFISVTAQWISENQKNGKIKQFYFDNSPPVILTDTTRLFRYVDPVHSGSNGLDHSYTGKDVVMGYIDQAVDFRHPDFKDASGKSRIMRIWDQTVNPAGNIFAHYGYGRLWDNNSIDNSTCTQLSPHDHGTNSVGIGSGNGLANGKNKGMAPDSKIVMVSTNINAANWVLTLVDACDYIFKYADSLGLPAVINISMGTSYWGSHDGNDPGTKLMEQLLEEKPGRIIVASAGNSGSQGKYHLRGNVTKDTTFVWFENDHIVNNVNSNTIMFDLWADTSDSHFDFAFGADKPAPSYGFRGRTNFKNTHFKLNTIQKDTIWNGNNRIATIQMWCELIDSAYNMQVYIKVDSSNYKFRFMTKGNGKYDLWSGVFAGGNTIVNSIPSSLIVPEIINYQMPDSIQTMVSSFQCSEKIITVGNIRNRYQYINNNGVLSNMSPNSPGNISPNSSAGPTRLGLVKPDITAEGDGTLTAWTMAHLTSAYNDLMALGGWHARVGGTSASAPVVAGIAALYLQKCPTASYADFKRDLIATATQNKFTGTVPNYKYGYGQPNALNLLLGTKNIPITGDLGVCIDPISLSVSPKYSLVDSIVWSNGIKTPNFTTTFPDKYSAKIYYGGGCVAYTDTVTLKQNIVLDNPIITDNLGVLTSNLQPNYQWFLNGAAILNETKQLLFISPPFGSYYLTSISIDGCISKSNSVTINLGLDEVVEIKSLIAPNPSDSNFSVITNEIIQSIIVLDNNGKEMNVSEIGVNKFSISNLDPGVYYLKIQTEKGLFYSKIIKS